MLDIPQIMAWAKEYSQLTADRILLGSNPIPRDARPLVALQVAQSKALTKKLPSWSRAAAYLPSALNLEQCSSELAASYKKQFVRPSDCILDMSAGLGVDFTALASRAKQGVYVEQTPPLIEAAHYNLPRVLPESDICIVGGDSMELLPELVAQHRPSLIFIDPARREGQVRDRRVYAIEDCTPNLLDLLEMLPCLYQDIEMPMPRLLVKLSPMLDITHTLRLVPTTSQLHIVSVRGEVKELLLYLDPELRRPSAEDIPIYVAELRESFESETHCWQAGLRGEQSTHLSIASSLGTYLYEPSGGMMKSGLFKSIAAHYDLQALHPDSHLYTSDRFVPDFIGRKFRCEEVIPFQASQLKRIGKTIGNAQISCRNFPLSPDELRKRLGIRDNSQRTILATKLWNDRQVLLNCYLCSYDG